jgi:oligopeptidase A
VLDGVRAEVAWVPIPDFNRFQHSFSHIFAGGYAAGYYSYLWADVLACDILQTFLQQGVVNAELGKAFQQTLLSQGGSKDFMDLFMAFQKRSPKFDALLTWYGLTE